MNKHVCCRFFTLGFLKPLDRTEEELQQTFMAVLGDMEVQDEADAGQGILLLSEAAPCQCVVKRGSLCPGHVPVSGSQARQQ